MGLIQRFYGRAGGNGRLYLFAGLYFAALAVIGLVFHRMGDGESEADFFASYVVQARSFLGGSIAIDQFRGPLYPIALGIAYTLLRLFGAGLFESGILLSAASASVVIFFSFRLIRALFGMRIAVVASALLVINPIFVRFSYTTGTDMFFTALATIAVYLLLRDPRPTFHVVAGSALVTGLAYLTRYNGISILAGAIVYVLAINVGRFSPKERLVRAGVMIFVFAMTILPWSLYTLAERGDLFYNRNYVNMAAGFYAEDAQMDHFLAENRGAFDSFVDVVRYDPVTFLVKIPVKAWRHTLATAEWVVLWTTTPFVVIGLLYWLIRRRERRQAGYLTFGLVYLATLWLVFYSERFVLFIIPICTMLAGLGVEALAGVVRNERTRPIMLAAIVILLVGFTGRRSVNYNRFHVPGVHIGLRLMGEAFKEKRSRDELGGKVVARKAYFAYFAGLDPLPLPIVNSHEELMDYIEETGADYLFYSGFAVQTRPGIRHLTDFRVKHPGLSPVAMTKIAVLYKVDRPRRSDR